MAQLSRPFQIGLLAVAVLAAAWLVLLRPHSANSTAPVPAAAPTAAVRTVKASAAPTTAKPTSPKAKTKGSGSSSIYHGSAPGVQGLTRAIAKANGAVATSQQNAKQLEEKSTQASSTTPTATATTPSAPAAAEPTTSAPAAKAPSTSSSSASAGHGAATRETSVARQHAVEAQLAKGRTVVILFWDPKGADDKSVHSAVRSLRSQHLNIDIQEASASQVASFGTITRGVQVYGTPTLLIVDKKGQAKTLTGLQDAFAISQAIREVQHPSS